jgi:hypothetical protein
MVLSANRIRFERHAYGKDKETSKNQKNGQSERKSKGANPKNVI